MCPQVVDQRLGRAQRQVIRGHWWVHWQPLCLPLGERSFLPSTALTGDVSLRHKAHQRGQSTLPATAGLEEKARALQKNTYSCFTDCTKASTVQITTKGSTFAVMWKILKEVGLPPDLPPEKPVCRSRSHS